MIRSNSLRALTLSAILALGAPMAAFAAPANTGGAAVPGESIQSIQTTRGSVIVAENTGNAASANGNALAGRAPVSRSMLGDSATANRGNGAVTSNEFGTGAQG